MSREQIPEETFPSDEELDDEEDDGADTDSSTDVDAKLAEEEVFDDEFFRCYSALKQKDSKIYDQNVKFFNEEKSSSEDEGTSKSVERLLDAGKKSAPKMTLLDHQLNLKDDEIMDPKIDLNRPISKSFYEKELEEIKRSIDKVNEELDSDSDDELLVVKGSDGKQSESGPKKKINLLLDALESKEDDDIKHLKEIWCDSSKLTKEEKFLRDYILNKRYVASQAEDQPSGTSKDRTAFFSENIDELSDVDDEDTNIDKNKDDKLHLHSEDKDFDKIKRIPRNSTKTIRDMVEKQEKKEKRQKKLDQEKKRKKALKDADCEDIVGDLPTRFHYRETEPNDYGLSAEELLMATDEELEKWVKLNEAIGYKSREEELAQRTNYERKRNDLVLKKEIFKSIYGDSGENDTIDNPESSAQKSKKRKRTSSNVNLSNDADDDGLTANVDGKADPPSEESNRMKKKKKHKRGVNHKKFAKFGVAPDRLLAYGLSKSKLKKSKLL